MSREWVRENEVGEPKRKKKRGERDRGEKVCGLRGVIRDSLDQKGKSVWRVQQLN
jgi:hypothetical protein